MQAPLIERIKAAILSLLEETKPPFPQPEILAQQLIKRERSLGYEQLIKSWTPIAKAVLDQRSAPPDDEQMVLGFRLDERLELAEQTVLFSEATVPKLQEKIRLIEAGVPAAIQAAADKIRRRAEEEVGRIRHLITALRMYRQPHQSISVGELKSLIDQGEPPRNPVSERVRAGGAGKAGG